MLGVTWRQGGCRKSQRYLGNETLGIRLRSSTAPGGRRVMMTWTICWSRERGLCIRSETRRQRPSDCFLCASYQRNAPRVHRGALAVKSIFIMIYQIGARGFEPRTSCSRSRRANRAALRPVTNHPSTSCHGPRGSRTLNLLIRSQMLYPVELWTQHCTGNDHRGASTLRVHPSLLAPRFSLLVLHGRYKARTCDLHDVNVAL